MSRDTSETARDPMDREEILARLEEIARGGSPTAALGALKALLAVQGDDDVPAEGFEALDELAPRRRNPMPSSPPKDFGVSERGPRRNRKAS